MAVYAAHLTRTSHGVPSAFTLAAQDALGHTVKPALRRVVEYLAAVYPDKCVWVERWFDELYLLFDLCLQYHYLKHYAASFSESFYGLVRVPAGGTAQHEFLGAGGARLPPILERGSLGALVLLPYVWDRTEARVQRWREDHEDGKLGKSTSDRLRIAATKLYSIVHLTVATAQLVQLARYVCGASTAHAPSLAVLRLALREAPEHVPEQDEYTWADLGSALITGNIGKCFVTFPMVGSLLLRGVEYGAFLVQFLRWWDSRGTSYSAHLPAPPPPARDERSVRYRNKCPLCLQPWRTPTVLPVSGYIFCYVCISRHLRSYRACPVSRCPATENSLVRLYLH